MTSDQKAFIKRNAKNMTAKEMADYLGTTAHIVRCFCIKREIEYKKVRFEPKSNEVFEVIRESRKKTFRNHRDGRVYAVRHYNVRCKLCGRKTKKEARRIAVLQSCGTQCTHFRKTVSKRRTAGAKKYEGKTVKEWAKIAGVTTNTIRCWLRERGDIKLCVPEYFKGE